MRVQWFAAAVGCAVLLIPFAAARAADADQPKLQGKWTVESFEYNGNPIEMLKDAVREFKDNKYTLKPKNGDVIDGMATIDSSKKPKEIDLEVNGRTLRGIYEFDGDTLKMSYNLIDGKRPTEFVSKPESGLVLVIHKRAK
jgi:uncharacterized protein (TIGR03067 family)